MGGRRRVVVVGSGMAATRLVEGLVASPAAGDLHITVVGDEAAAPYNRILLSAVLEGTHGLDAITLRAREWYGEHGVDLRLGSRVLGVDRKRRDLMLVDGTVLPYDRLVLATGSIPSLPPIRGLVRLDGRLHEAVHAFRSLDDCRRLMTAIGVGVPHADDEVAAVSDQTADPVVRPAQRAVVVGGGLLGLQVARALSVRGLDVEIVEGGEHLLRSHVGSLAGQVLARDLRRLGTTVYTGARAVRLTDTALISGAQTVDAQSRVGLRLDNGYTLDTDLVVLAPGGRPSTALARGADLEVRRGIVVDDHLASVTDPDIFAMGDCAEHSGRTTGFVGPAWEQAEVLARRLTDPDGDATYSGSRSVARLRATGLDVAVLGDPERATADGGEVVEVTNPVVGSHRKLVVRDGVIVAATLVGDLSRIGLITQYFDRGTRLCGTEPAALLMGDRKAPPNRLADDTEICACAGVSAGRIRACSSLDEVRASTRATTGCGSCSSSVAQLLRPALTTSS